MDDIAASAGVSRRSLFRHFDSRDALIAQALSDTLDEYHASLAAYTDTDAQQSDAPLEQWLDFLAVRFHQAVTESRARVLADGCGR